MGDHPEAKEEHGLERLSVSGILSAFVEAYEGNWNHDQWLELVAYARELGCQLPEERLGQAIEDEKHSFLGRLLEQEKAAAHAQYIDETITLIDSSGSFLDSLERMKAMAGMELGHDHKRKLRDILSGKFVKEVKSRLSKGAWIPKRMVNEVEELTRKFSD